MSIKEQIKDKLDKYISYKNPKYFYKNRNGDFFGSHTSLIIRFYSLLLSIKSKRLLQLILYSSNKFIMKSFGKSKQMPIINLNDIELNMLEELRKNGIIILDGYFKNNIDHIFSYYKEFIKNNNKKDQYNRSFSNFIDLEILNVILDKTLLRVATSYNGCKTYLRGSHSINITINNINDITSRDYFNGINKSDEDYADFWHLDTPHYIQFHILLNDVSMNDPHMIFAKGSHLSRWRNICQLPHSEEYVNDNFNLAHCIGEKGTVYLFDGSRGLHRMFRSKKGKRITMEIPFSKGLNVYANKQNIPNLNKIDLSNLGTIQKDALNYLLKSIKGI